MAIDLPGLEQVFSSAGFTRVTHRSKIDEELYAEDGCSVYVRVEADCGVISVYDAQKETIARIQFNTARKYISTESAGWMGWFIQRVLVNDFPELNACSRNTT